MSYFKLVQMILFRATAIAIGFSIVYRIEAPKLIAMNTHGNNTTANITPQQQNGTPTASNNNSKEPSATRGPGPKTHAKKLKFDARLESARHLIELQPLAIQNTLSDTAIAMLLTT